MSARKKGSPEVASNSQDSSHVSYRPSHASQNASQPRTGRG